MEVKSVKLYPPVVEKMEDMNIPNFNYWVNSVIGRMLGVDPRLIDAYKRNKSEHKEDDEA